MIGPYPINTVIHGHALELSQQLPDNSLSAIITSPPYWGLRLYKTLPAYWPEVTFQPMAGLPTLTVSEQRVELGQEPEPWAYVAHLVALFRELRRTLHPMGSLWLNLGDSYARDAGKGEKNRGGRLGSDLRGAREGCPKMHIPDGLKQKDLVGIPWRTAFALQADGWFLRADIPWIKRNGMPGSQQDRPTTSKEYWFLLSKSPKYYFDQEAVKLPVAKSSKSRLSQDVANQKGSPRANGGTKTNGSMKAVGDSGGRYRRDSDWFFDSLRAIVEDNAQVLLTDEEGKPLGLSANPVGYKAAHFATFPPALVTPMILSSTSERGHCSECGSPYTRILEKVKGENPSYNGSSFQKGKTKEAREFLGTDGAQERTAATITIGWQPTCQCEAIPIPAVVLDPFFGSGTTGQVAAKNRRHYLGFEFNEDYLSLAPERVTTQIKMF